MLELSKIDYKVGISKEIKKILKRQETIKMTKQI